MNFRSDNEAPVNPRIMQALLDANQGFTESYGYDEYTERLEARMRELFECWVAVLPLTTGTAANAIAVAQSTAPYGAVYCHQHSHLNADECGAPEFFSHGAKLVGMPGPHGKLQADDVRRALQQTGVHGEHECLPQTISITQSSEAGTVYSREEVAAMAALKSEFNLALHMDGARFANAVTHLGCSPADITWRSGVDMLSFGATKNGAMVAEALLVFDPKYATELKRARKRGAQLVSKMRYVSAQWLAYLEDDLWLQLAQHANAMAARFERECRDRVEFLHPVQANEAFCRLPLPTIESLQKAGFEFHIWPGSQDVIRLVFSHATEEGHVLRLIEHLHNQGL